MEGKQGFEQHSASFGIKIKTYHADNGIFVERSFRDEIKISEQQITFCGVRVHHQNGIVENHIGFLTVGSRTDLLHAQHRWSEKLKLYFAHILVRISKEDTIISFLIRKEYLPPIATHALQSGQIREEYIHLVVPFSFIIRSSECRFHDSKIGS